MLNIKEANTNSLNKIETLIKWLNKTSYTKLQFRLKTDPTYSRSKMIVDKVNFITKVSQSNTQYMNKSLEKVLISRKSICTTNRLHYKLHLTDFSNFQITGLLQISKEQANFILFSIFEINLQWSGYFCHESMSPSHLQ